MTRDTLFIDRSRQSPNHGPRAPEFPAPDMIVLHYTGMADGPSAVDWLCNPVSQVSCHYVVAEDGRILQLVPDAMRAWHAGRSCWAGVTDINSASIGIEIVNGGHDFGLPPFPAVQIEAVAALCAMLVERHRIEPSRVLAHSDIAPARKRDPGELFPWDVLAVRGLGLYAPPAPDRSGEVLASGSTGQGVRRLQGDLARLGFGLGSSGVYDEDTACVVRAFQRHFRPSRIDGCADPGTRDTLDHLLEVAKSA